MGITRYRGRPLEYGIHIWNRLYERYIKGDIWIN